MKLFLNRLYDDGTRTLGRLIVYDALSRVLDCVTLEPPWIDNKQSVSCIPTGEYKLTPRTSPKFGQHYWLSNVSGREFILVHVGNMPEDTSGCILTGEHFADIDGDGRLDVIKSKAAFERLKRCLKDDTHTLYISGDVPLRKRP